MTVNLSISLFTLTTTDTNWNQPGDVRIVASNQSVSSSSAGKPNVLRLVGRSWSSEVERRGHACSSWIVSEEKAKEENDFLECSVLQGLEWGNVSVSVNQSRFQRGRKRPAPGRIYCRDHSYGDRRQSQLEPVNFLTRHSPAESPSWHHLNHWKNVFLVPNWFSIEDQTCCWKTLSTKASVKSQNVKFVETRWNKLMKANRWTGVQTEWIWTNGFSCVVSTRAHRRGNETNLLKTSSAHRLSTSPPEIVVEWILWFSLQTSKCNETRRWVQRCRSVCEVLTAVLGEMMDVTTSR